MAKERILVVDDTPANIKLLCDVLGELDNLHLSVANSGERALELAERDSHDLILLDVMMPGLNGFEVCQRLRESEHHKDIPILFVTALADDASRGFEVGGNDYITKPINPGEVVARVSHHLERRRLFLQLKSLNETLEQKVRERTAELAVTNRQLREEIKERRYVQDRLQYLATHDFVTHLFNRNALEGFVTETISVVQLSRETAIFMLVDLERFRLINESCGCFAGDELLRQVADIVTSYSGRDDFVARIGGDKFVVICRNTTLDEGAELGRSLQVALQNFTYQWEDRQFTLAASVALVTIDSDITSFDQLMLMSDEVLYHLKRENQPMMSYDQLQRSKISRPGVNWAVKLMDGLEYDRFVVYFQKIVSLQHLGDPRFKLEALVRLRDADSDRIISPDEFIPAAERYNLIADIDRWMIDRVLRYLCSQGAAQPHLISVSINLSATTLRSEGLATYIEQKMKEYPVDPSRVAFEVTETEFIVNMDAARSVLRQIKSLGCNLVLDDFGKGYSSFNYLRELPFDTVKIDGVFIRDIDKNASHLAMVRSIVEVARQLDKTIVAEFVESEAIVEVLRELNVEWAQGYHFHKPEPMQNLISHSERNG